jgi:hypothetical protein
MKSFEEEEDEELDNKLWRKVISKNGERQTSFHDRVP